jgi:hypothetical protein
MTYRTLTLYAGRGTAYLMRSLGLVLAASIATAVGLAALNSLLRPGNAGLFLVEPDTYQLRVLGLSPGTGEQLLAPWIAVMLILLSVGALAWAARRARRMLLELIAR